ncbi:pheophorbide a oxygenase [Monoraphidium neglectum]|uniref:Pheophorbide a oxygenase n=1 Tax=Monoraphidium neglectum TaxID=145388 RepID=A0A0D2MXN6_9CHLO|nr:pheophorbide a oxygenase [Monoraphidium neglectum]KIZ07245.1 pheophorbide a oxygenase [Monoraphidium neglectum]|eukprot:XP_013906264.1 pheophorbide a oxygenase [Monoraphidium neglectum]
MACPLLRPFMRNALGSGGMKCETARRPAISGDVAALAASAPAGGDVDQRGGLDAAPKSERQRPSYDYFAEWWPVAFTADLDKEQLHRFMLLGQPLVIWWDAAGAGGGAWRAFLDVCPHRLVPLSEGRVNSAGRLECPYHGWEFSGQGNCERIPQGLLFVRPKTAAAGGPADETRIQIVRQLEDPEWVSQDTFRDVPYDWSTLLENVLDASHVPFTHHKSISNRAVVGDYVTKLTEPVTAAGFSGVWPSGPRAGALGPQYGEFRAPGFMQQTIDMIKTRGAESLVVVYAVPSSPGKCRLINRNAFKFHKSKLPGAIMRMVPGWLVHVGTQIPLEDDQIFLHYGEEAYVKARAQGLSVGKAYYMPSQADTYVTAFRRWLDDFGGGGPWGPPDAAYLSRLEPRLPREALLDRYTGHVQSCAQCQRALKQVKTGRSVLRVVSGALAAGALLAAAVAVCVAAAAGGGGGSAAATGASSATLSRLGAAALAAAGWVAGAGLQTGAAAAAAAGGGAMLRALVLGLAALLTWRVSEGVLGGLEHKLLRGDYPPPRNTDKSN